MATLYRCPKSGRFYANLVGLDGRRERKSLKTSDPKEAEALLANIIRQNSHARILGVENVKEAQPTTYKVFVETVYLPSCKANLKASTYSIYQDYANKTVPIFGDKYLSAIGPDEIGRYLDELRTGAYLRGKNEYTYSVATINRYKNFISGVFTDAVDRELISKHPMRGRKRFKNRQENNLRIRCLSPFEEKRLVEFAPSWLAPIIRLALATGLRRGEILKLRWQDYDKQSGILRLKDTKAGKDQSMRLNRTAQEILEAVAPFVADGKVSPWVFTNATTKTAYDRWDVSHAFEGTVKRAGLEDAHFHDLRHTAGTKAYRATKDIKAVQKLLRHSSLTPTLRYVHDAEEDLQAAVNALNEPEKAQVCRSDKPTAVAK